MKMTRWALGGLSAALLAACAGGGDGRDAMGTGDVTGSAPGIESDAQEADAGAAPVIDDGVTPIAVLGGGTHSASSVWITPMYLETDGLNEPTDAEFHPDVPGQLWVTNRGGNAVVIYENAGTNQVASWRSGGNSVHFLAKPAALAFGTGGMMATAQQEDQVTQPGTPPDFMGPTMWTSDATIFNGGHATHTDMLHNSPNSSGIAWEVDNVYWVYDGHHGALTRYDFQKDHGLAGADHSDGIVRRYVDGQLGYVPGVPAHVALDHASGLLYAADPENGVVAVLDIHSGTEAGPIYPNYDGTSQRYVNDADLRVLIDGSTLTPALSMPSGLELHDGVLYVSDPSTSTLMAFSLEGELLDWLHTDLPPGGLAGMAFAPDGALWVTDRGSNALWRIAPK